MTPLICITILILGYLVVSVAEGIRRHELAGYADLLAARLISLADAWRHGKAHYRSTYAFNRQWAANRKIGSAV